VELIKNHGTQFGYSGQASWDFAQMIRRSRSVAGQLNRGIEGLFRKYKVNSKIGVAKVVSPHQVQVDGEVVSAESIMIATGVRPRPLPGAEFDGKVIISYKEAMVLPRQPQSLLIIGAGPIGLEFGYFYNAIGTKVTVVELLDRILPGEDEEISASLHQSLTKRGLTILTSSKTAKVEKRDSGVKAEVETPKGKTVVEAERMLVAIGVLGNVEDLFAADLKVEIVKHHIQADAKNGYATSVPGIYAVGDVIGPPWLAHVAHHEAICCIERLCGFADRTVDYTTIPGCTYTDPGVASVGLTEKAAREAGYEVRLGKFPFVFSGRALASDETEGFVKLVFDAKYGELLGAHLIGSQATELIAELVMAKKLEATEEEILHAIHPHPTYSEAIMEAAGQGLGESIHL
jgi:dihydrolipoamide dehydrogenase